METDDSDVTVRFS